jgi:hypothetical protein
MVLLYVAPEVRHHCVGRHGSLILRLFHLMNLDGRLYFSSPLGQQPSLPLRHQLVSHYLP